MSEIMQESLQVKLASSYFVTSHV